MGPEAPIEEATGKKPQRGLMMKNILITFVNGFSERSTDAGDWMFPFALGALCAGVVFASRYHYYEGELRKQIEDLKKRSEDLKRSNGTNG